MTWLVDIERIIGQIVEQIKANGVLIIGAIGVYIAWRQHRTARHKLKLDLYDRRFKVYTATLDYIRAVIQKVTLDKGDYAKFYTDTAGSEFLFDKELSAYLKELRDKVTRLRKVNWRLDDERIPVGDERSKLADEDAELLEWFSKEVDEVDKVFKPYLWFGNIR